MKRLKIESRESTLLCDNRNGGDSLHCKLFKNPKKPIKYTVKEDQYRYVRQKPKEEGEWQELKPDKEFDTKSLQFVGPGTVISRDEIGVADITRLGGKPGKTKRVEVTD